MKVESIGAVPRDLDALLAAWAYKPFRWWTGLSDGQLCGLAAHRIGALVQRAGTRSWAVRQGPALLGIGILQPLEWDSRMLGVPAARIDFFSSGEYPDRAATAGLLLDTMLAEAVTMGVQHVSVRVDAEDDAAIHTVESRGFLNVDALMTFGAELGSMPQPELHPSLAVRPARSDDIDDVSEISATSVRYSRFHSDPAISPEVAAAVHREWAAACVQHRAADQTMVAVDEGRVVGFVACRIPADTGTYLRRPTGGIVLIASAPWARRRGVGTALMSAAAGWFLSRGAPAAEVGTQLRNVPAARLYEHSGFRLVSGALSFRNNSL